MNELPGSKIRKLREEQELTQEELAGRARIATRVLQRIESGRANPKTATLNAIAHALGCSMADLYTAAVSVKAAQEKIEATAAKAAKMREGIATDLDNRHVTELTVKEMRALVSSESKRDGAVNIELGRLKKENERLQQELAGLKGLPMFDELISSWKDAEPEERVIGLLALTGKSSYLSHSDLSTENRKVWQTVLRASGKRPRRT